jgi:uncharacterized ion transporter superfamily protein YfcC
MKKKKDKAPKKSKKSLKKRFLEGNLSPEFTGRMRLILFVLAFIFLFLAFEVGDDWFVREFANYDWARSIGY